MQIIARKLTPDSICTKERLNQLPVVESWLYRIAGFATGSEDYTHPQFGDSVALTGEFQAINFETGENFIGNRCFLPAGMAEVLAGNIGTTEGKVGKQRVLFDIGIKPSTRAGSPKPYEFIIRSPMDDAKDTESGKLLASIPLPDSTKQLIQGKTQPLLPGVS